MAKLIITENGKDKIYEIVDEEFVIGSGDNAGVRLRSDDVSANHVSIKKTRNGYRLIDLESRTGTKVNGATVNEHELANGDTIEIGSVKIAYIGKGTKAAATAAPKGGRPVKLEHEKLYRRDAAKTRSSGANLAIIGASVVGLIVVVLFMLNSSTPGGDTILIELKNSRTEVERQGAAVAADAEKVLDKYRNKRDLSDLQKRAFADLESAIAQVRAVDVSRKVEQEAGPVWVEIHNKMVRTPNDYEGIIKLCESFISLYPTAEKIGEVKSILADTKSKGTMSPEQRELARVQVAVQEQMADGVRNARLAMKAIKSMDRKVEAVLPDEVEKLTKHVRMKSRQWLGIRKNEVREFTGAPTMDLEKAEQIARDRIFEKLVLSTVEDYLASPDKYSSEMNQKAELELQKLLRRLVDEYKKKD